MLIGYPGNNRLMADIYILGVVSGTQVLTSGISTFYLVKDSDLRQVRISAISSYQKKRSV